MHLPGPLRAAVGLAATAAAEAKHLPDRAIELPMLVVSTALQASLRAQQRYARLAARGDEVLNRRPVTAEPPEWATFDEPLSVAELRRSMYTDAADPESDTVSLAESMVGTLFGVADPHESSRQDADPGATTADARGDFEAARRDEAARRTAAAKKTTSARKAAAGTGRAPRKAAAKKAATRKAATKQAATKTAARKTARKAPGAKAAAAKPVSETPAPGTAAAETIPDATVPAATVPAATVPDATVADAPVTNAPATAPTDGTDTAATKPVHKPRHITPSAFDDVADD